MIQYLISGIVFFICLYYFVFYGSKPSSIPSIKTKKKTRTTLGEKCLVNLRLNEEREQNLISISVNEGLMERKEISDLNDIIKVLNEISVVIIVSNISPNENFDKKKESLLKSLPEIIDPDNILIHSTSIGKTAMIRQLNPSIHIEYDLHSFAPLSTHHKVVFWQIGSTIEHNINSLWIIKDIREILEITV